MNPILNIAIRAIRMGGKNIVQYYDTKNVVRTFKKKEISYYIRIIRNKTFSIIYSIIKKSYPQHAILNIFSKKKKINNSNQWLINPLTGTVNFIHKIPHFCLSILMKEKNKKFISVIYDPIKNDLFTAIKGQGSQLNGFRTRCCEYDKNFYKKIVTCYFKNKNNQYIYLYISLIQQLLIEHTSIRHTGCSLLDLAYLSSGKIHAYISFNQTNLNIIFGELQIRESGALITDFVGGHNYIQNKLLLIGHANILKYILKKTRIINKLHFEKNQKK